MRLFVALILASTPALADEAPCRADGDRVSCDRPSFDTLVKSCVDSKAAAKACAIRLDAMAQSVDDAETALAACLSRPPPEPVVIKPTAFRAVGPVVLGVVGAAILTASVTSDWAVGGRATGAIVGSAFVGTGIVFALP